MWSVSDIADALHDGLAAASAARDREQSAYGLDALDELGVHPVLEQALRRAGYGVFREQRYPPDRNRRIGSEGERCDFVLTPDARQLVVPDAAQTLFEPVNAVPVDEAFWLEVKVVHQFTTEGTNPRYASQLLSTVGQDVTKLSKDAVILHAGLLMVLFVAEAAVADHDLKVWEERCLQRGLPIGAPSVRTLAIPDRIGNGVCRVSVYPVSHL